jgi:putative ABC transport system substrate-binding protein
MQFDQLKRREFITLLGGGAAAWPLAARAQQPGKVARIGVVGPRPESAARGAGYPAMLDELRKLGFTENRNLIVEFRSYEQEAQAIFSAAAELVRSNVDVLVAIGSEVALQAAVAASSTIPIVIAAIDYDPIARGYVKSLRDPGGNITGMVLRRLELVEKQVELLREVFPERTRLAVLWDESSSLQFSAAERRAPPITSLAAA